MSINTRFRLFRKYIGIDQLQMAECLGVVRSAVSNYEKEGNAIPNYVKIILRYQYRLNSNWLDSGEGEMLIEELDSKNVMSNNDKLRETKSENENEKEVDVRDLIQENREMIQAINKVLQNQGNIISEIGEKWLQKKKENYGNDISA